MREKSLGSESFSDINFLDIYLLRLLSSLFSLPGGQGVSRGMNDYHLRNDQRGARFSLVSTLNFEFSNFVSRTKGKCSLLHDISPISYALYIYIFIFVLSVFETFP